MARARSATCDQIDARHVQPLGGVDQLRHARDLRRLVADALQIGDGLHHRDQQAQVAGGRLAARDDLAAGLVEADLESVDAVVVGDHAVDQVHLAGDQGLHRARDLFLDQAAHLQHA